MSRFFGQHSFRTAILWLVLGSLSVTVSVVGVVAFINSSRSVEELREREYQLTSQLVAKEASHLVAVAPKLLYSQAALAARGVLNLNDLDSLGVFLAESLRTQNDLSWLTYGSAETGGFVGAWRDEQGRIIINRSEPTVDAGRPSEFFVLEDGSHKPLQRGLAEGYDARYQPWFKEAIRSRKAVWSNIYTWHDGVRGVTLSLAARRQKTGEVIGVFTADYTLDDVGRFLRSLAGVSGRVLILATPDGQLMGSASTIGGPSPVKSTLAAIPITLLDLKPDVPVRFNFQYEGHPMIGIATLFEPTPGFTSVAVFAADKQEFFKSVDTSARWTAYLGLAALLGAAAISIILAARLARPLALISADLKKIAGFDLQKAGRPQSSVTEISSVSESVELMKAGLRSFGRYVPTTLVRSLLSQGRDAEIGAEERELTILFADLAGFTSLSETLSPSETVEEMSDFFELATDAVEHQTGTLDKFLGDGLLAFFNAPLEVSDHAVKGCLAALDIRDRLAAAEPARAANGRPLIRARFGLNTGEVLVGNIGTKERFAYTVIGDNANLASRLETLNKQYGTTILASEATCRATGTMFLWRQVDRVVVMGRHEATTVYELIGLASEIRPDLIVLRDQYEIAMKSYIAGDFREALALFDQIIASYPFDSASRTIAERCRALMNAPPSEWNGVFIPNVK